MSASKKANRCVLTSLLFSSALSLGCKETIATSESAAPPSTVGFLLVKVVENITIFGVTGTCLLKNDGNSYQLPSCDFA
jgi:hypothetical protein